MRPFRPRVAITLLHISVSSFASVADETSEVTFTVDENFITTKVQILNEAPSCIAADSRQSDLLFYRDKSGGPVALYAPDPKNKKSRSAIFDTAGSRSEEPLAFLYRLATGQAEPFSKKSVKDVLPGYGQKQNGGSVVFPQSNRAAEPEGEGDLRSLLADELGFSALRLDPCGPNRRCALLNESAFFVSVNECRSGSEGYRISFSDFSDQRERLVGYLETYDSDQALQMPNPKLLGRFVENGVFTAAIGRSSSTADLDALTRIADAFGHRDDRFDRAVMRQRNHIDFETQYRRAAAPESDYREIKTFIASYADRNLTAAQQTKISTLSDEAYRRQKEEALASEAIEKTLTLLADYPEHAAENLAQAQARYREKGAAEADAGSFERAYRLSPNETDLNAYLKLATDEELENASFVTEEHIATVAAALTLRRAENMPAAETPAIVSDKLFVDREYALMWQDIPANKTLKLTWQDAVDFCKESLLEGYSDWTLPMNHDLTVLFHKRRELKHAAAANYWSVQEKLNNRDLAYTIDFTTGYRAHADKNAVAYVRCVREHPEDR